MVRLRIECPGDLHHPVPERLVHVAPAPAQGPAEVIAGAQGQHAHRGRLLEVDLDIVLQKVPSEGS